MWTGDEDVDKYWLLDTDEEKLSLLLFWDVWLEFWWELFNIEELLCFGDIDWFDSSVEFGDEGFNMNDLDGVECTELIAARYCNETKEKNRKRKTN